MRISWVALTLIAAGASANAAQVPLATSDSSLP